MTKWKQPIAESQKENMVLSHPLEPLAWASAARRGDADEEPSGIAARMLSPRNVAFDANGNVASIRVAGPLILRCQVNFKICATKLSGTGLAYQPLFRLQPSEGPSGQGSGSPMTDDFTGLLAILADRRAIAAARSDTLSGEEVR